MSFLESSNLPIGVRLMSVASVVLLFLTVALVVQVSGDQALAPEFLMLAGFAFVGVAGMVTAKEWQKGFAPEIAGT